MKKEYLIVVFLFLSNFIICQSINLNKIENNYESYRLAAEKWNEEDYMNWTMAVRMVIDLPKDRTRYGTITLGRNNLSFGSDGWAKENKPFKCLGRSLVSIKEEMLSGNTPTVPSYYLENVPVGEYYGFILDSDVAKLALPTLTKTDLGGQGIIILTPQTPNKRKGIIIHGGTLKNGHIPPGVGAIKMSNSDIQLLIKQLLLLRNGVRMSDLTAQKINPEFNKFNELPGWEQLEVYESFLRVRINERKPSLRERISKKKTFYNKGISIKEDSEVNYSSGYFAPHPLSNYSLVHEYYKMKTIGEDIVIFKIANDLNEITKYTEQFHSGIIDAQSLIDQLKYLIKSLQKNNEELKKIISKKGNAVLTPYTNDLSNYLDYLKGLIQDWEKPDTVNKKPDKDCDNPTKIGTRCLIVVQQCQYECENGETYSENCGGCIVFPF